MREAQTIIDTINRVYKNGLTTTSGGNLSVKDEEGNIYITPSGKDKGTLKVKDVCVVDAEGNCSSKLKPSIELPFHSLIYQLRPDVKAVLHVHSPYLVSYSLLNEAPEIRIMPASYEACGNVGTSLYDIPGSIELGKQIAKYIEKGYDSVMMQNHGVVLVAPDMQTAYDRLETLENCAKTCLYAKMLGRTRVLDDYTLQQYLLHSNPVEVRAAEDISLKEARLRKEMCAFAKRCADHGFFTSSNGVISVRLNDDAFLITPKKFDRAALDPAQIVRIEGGVAYGGLPSRRWKIHARIYTQKAYVNSIMQASSPAVMAYAVTDEPLGSRTIPESYIMMRDVTKVPFGSDINGSEPILRAITPATPVVLVENNFVLTTGETLTKAFDRLEVSEITAKNLLLGKVLGTPISIDDTEIDKIDRAFSLPQKE